MTTSSPKKSYNQLALRGGAVDDMEYVEMFGLDPSVAYTPKINDVMLERTRLENIEFYKKQGMEEPEAKTKAMANYLTAKKNITNLLNKQK